MNEQSTSRSQTDIASDGSAQNQISKSSSSLELTSSQSALGQAGASSSQWPTDIKKYNLIRLIGHGATSKVYAAEFQDRKCAIKIINLENCSSNDGLKEINREIASMKRLKHENIVGYYVSFVTDTKLRIVMDLCEKGSLLDMIKLIQNSRTIQQGVFDEVAIASILKDVLRGLNYIHDNDLVHRDLKCGNLLVRNDGCIQIADFGVTAFLNNFPQLEDSNSEAGTRRTFVGTPCWMAPEVMNQVQGYNWKADIWSLGITAIELARGQAPYARYAPFKVLMMTLQNEPPTIDTCASHPNQYENYGQKFRKFCRACLVKDPSARASTRDLLQHSYIKSKAKDRDYILKTLFSGQLPPPPTISATDVGDETSGSMKPSTAVEDELSEREGVDGRGASGRLDGGVGPAGGSGAADWDFPQADKVDEAVARMMSTGGAADDINMTLQAGSPMSTDPALQSARQAGGGVSGTGIAPNVPPTNNMSFTGSGTGLPGDAANSPTARPPNAKIYRITLMKRNQNAGNELQNISFVFVVGSDSADSLANDLVKNDLLERKNFCLVAHKINELVEQPELKERSFPLYSEPSSGSAGQNDTDMHGYAKLSISLYDSERDKELI